MSKRIVLVGCVGLVAWIGCQVRTEHTEMSKTAGSASAVAVLHPTEGNDVRGSVTFTAVEEGVRVAGAVTGLQPGKHGFHIHEYGDCSANDGTSAGGHFAPRGMPHGGRTDSLRHIGDLGNIEANEDGVAAFDFIDTELSLDGKYAIQGRGVIVHAGADDLSSQPTGAAGARVACGVIGVRGLQE